jgi:hypothetical protein
LIQSLFISSEIKLFDKFWTLWFIQFTDLEKSKPNQRTKTELA